MRRHKAPCFRWHCYAAVSTMSVCLPLSFAQAMKAMSEVVENPSRIENWRHKPQLYALLKKMLGQA